MSWGWREFFPKSKPRPARGGIKAQSKRGQFGATWWSRRWVEVLEGFPIGARLQRGRSYARGGQVLSIDVEPGEVKAAVQGSRPKPYAVTVAVKPLTQQQWDRVVKALASRAVFAAKLLAGEMPDGLEEAFAAEKAPLFPAEEKDLQTDCSCPDWSNPCKHVAAVYYLLAEEFDRDPFLLLRLRGLDREALLERLGKAGATKQVEPEAVADVEAPPAEPLPVDPAQFWSGPPVPEGVFGDVAVPAKSAAWLRRLGAFPFWRGAKPVQEALEPVYREASQRGLSTYLGEADRPQA